MNEHLEPISKKVALFELNIGQRQRVAFNFRAGVNYVDFDAVYALIAAEFLGGVSPQAVATSIGSVSSDAASLLLVGSLADVQATELSFYYDAPDKALYMHLQDGDRMSLHNVVIGIVYGVAKHAGIYGGAYYEGRLVSAPKLTKSRDSLFFGVISQSGGEVEINNEPDPGQLVGPFDRLGEERHVFGNYAQLLFGFNDQEYSQFVKSGYGLIEAIDVGDRRLRVTMRDYRSALTAPLPERVMALDEYPNLKENSIGSFKPITYGPIRNMKAVCLNEEESPAPGTYTFLFSDTTYHEIHAVSEVRVDGVVVVPSSVDLVAGTFVLAAADYDPGQEVTLDLEGYEDDAGDLIENALDVIADLFLNHQGLAFTPSTYDQGEWLATRLACPSVGLLVEKEQELKKVLEAICTSARVNVIFKDDGRLTAWRYVDGRPPVQTFALDDFRSIPSLGYDSTEVVSRVRVGYDRDWASGEFKYALYTDQEAEVFARYGQKRPRTFETLLTTQADAVALAQDVMLTSAFVGKKFNLDLKTQPLMRDVGHVIRCPVRRRSGSGLIGDVRAEILEVTKDAMAARIQLRCRVIEVYADTFYVEAGFYDDDFFYGDTEGGFYGASGEVEIE